MSVDHFDIMQQAFCYSLLVTFVLEKCQNITKKNYQASIVE